jgi:hypothetical protein
MKKFILILFLLLPQVVFAAGYCTDYENTTTDVITYTPEGDPSAINDCEFAPDGYEIVIYDFGMCTAQPTAPTTAVAADYTTNCVSIYQNDEGEAFNLAAGASFSMTGSEKPANGTYTWGYVLMANTFGITIAQEFGNTMGGINSGSGTGNFCWSAGGSYYGSMSDDEANNDGIDYVTCGDSAGTARKVTETLDSFGCDDPTDVSTCPFSANGVTDDGTMYAYIILSSDGLLADQTYASDPASVADRLVGYLDWTTPVVITDSTSTVDLQFSVNNGTSPQLFPPSNGNGAEFDIYSFGSGPFSVNISVD